MARLYLNHPEFDVQRSKNPLYGAAYHGHVDIIALLLRDGRIYPSDSFVLEDLRSLLDDLWCGQSDLDVVRALMGDERFDHGCDPGILALFLAVCEGNVV